MRFFNNDIYSEKGSPIKETFSPVVDENGNINLVVSGKINTDEEIESYRDECDINVIIQRYANGDLNALNRKKPLYGDFTGMPKTYAEVLQLQIDSRNLFNSLPASIKEKFENDENKFFVQAGTKEWMDILEPLMNPNQEIIKTEENIKESEDIKE